MKKKLLGILLAALLILSLASTLALAGEEIEETEANREENECSYDEKLVAPVEGDLELWLNGDKVGDYTFARFGAGWSIWNGEKYVAAVSGRLTYTDIPFMWTFRGNCFSYSVITYEKAGGYWVGFFYFPEYTKVVTTNYYFSTISGGTQLSLTPVRTALIKHHTGEEHEYRYFSNGDKTHNKFCVNCHKTETEDCSFSEVPDYRCECCGAINPEKIGVEIGVNVKREMHSEYIGIWPFGHYEKVTTFVATINTRAIGVRVVKVEYSLDGGRSWHTGTKFTSYREIKDMKVRALGSNGEWYYWPEEEPDPGDIVRRGH